MTTTRHRLERHTWGSVPDADRSNLSERCHALFSRWFEGISHDAFVARYLADDAARLGLLRDASGTITGFSVVNRTRLVHNDGEVVVFTAPVISEPGTGGGALISWFGLTEALRFKLRHPRTRLGYLGLTMTPSAYLVIARTMPRFFPANGVAIPEGVDALIGAACAARGIVQEPGSFVARGLRPRSAAEQRANARLMAHPDAAHFERLNPHWAAGDALLVYIPLDLVNVLGALPRTLSRAPQKAHVPRATDPTIG